MSDDWRWGPTRYTMPYFFQGGRYRRSSHSPGLALVILGAIAALWWLAS